jgi:hypothetical protein
LIRLRIKSQGPAQYGTVSSGRRTRSADRTPNISGESTAVPSLISLEDLRGEGLFCRFTELTRACDAMFAPHWLAF